MANKLNSFSGVKSFRTTVPYPVITTLFIVSLYDSYLVQYANCTRMDIIFGKNS